MPNSPFALARFEYEAQHLYFLHDDFLTSLEQPKPAFLIGSRGTGKTTLLKSLDWRERVANQSLCRQLGNDVFHGDVLGIYMKLPEIQLTLVSDWLTDENVTVRAAFIGTYLDLLFVEQITDALADLIAKHFLTSSVSAEQESVNSVRLSLQPLYEAPAEPPPTTLKDLSIATRRIRRHLETAARHRHSLVEIQRHIPAIDQVGHISRTVGEQLAPLACHGDRRLQFKVCMDEGECLTPEQQLVVNTLLRLAKWPVFHVVSFVTRPADLSRTLIPSLTLNQADRELILLDGMSLHEFRRFATGVATVRVQNALDRTDVAFEPERVLGTLNLSSTLESILRESVSPFAKTLLTRAQALAQHPFIADALDFDGPTSETPSPLPARPLPIYQAYLAAELGLSLPRPDDVAWERRRQDSAEMRKKMVAAYLAICRDLGVAVRYESSDMLSFPKTFPPGVSQNLSTTRRAGGRSLLTAS